MKFIFTFSIFLFFCCAYAQEHSQFVPFKFEGKLGLLNVSGTELIPPDAFVDGPGNYDVVGDFQSYIIAKNEGEDKVIDARSGEEQFVGRLDRTCGLLRINKDSYYHFKVNGNSVLLNSAGSPIQLTTSYKKIEPNHDSWDNGSVDDKQYLWALKEDETYDVLAANDGFTPVNSLPKFESFDLVYGLNVNAPLTLIGFVLGSKTAIQRTFGQKYGIPESSYTIEVYNTSFKKLGTTVYEHEAIAKLFNQKIELRGSMIPPPGMANQILIPQNRTIVLNNEFSLIPATDDPGQLVLVNTQQGNAPVLGNDHFDYRYISTSKNLEALLQIRHSETGTFFYFDFDGLYFPKGVPLIPKKYRQWN
ncbi:MULTISPECIES: hypothetical protein [Sphingobacterium]|uniref:hypothetical protein n=1 Tax=Sphingobacterium TaxID=28453 RepID=UPI00257AD0AA|nr:MULTISPECIES: hypothetical protein [Sphingobacterium]